MSDNARRADATPPTGRPEPFGLEAYLDRQHEEFARSGPSAADILSRADRRRGRGTLSREDIVAVIREDREERS